MAARFPFFGDDLFDTFALVCVAENADDIAECPARRSLPDVYMYAAFIRIEHECITFAQV
jgi:hypothetical protein